MDQSKILSPEIKEQLIADIIVFFAAERDLEIGPVAAQEILDFFMTKLNNTIYNQALEDAKSTFRFGIEKTLAEIDVLVK